MPSVNSAPDQHLHKQSEQRHEILYRLGILALAGVWLLFALTHLDFFGFRDDEGTFLVSAQAVWAGHALYREVWFNYFSGFMNLLCVVFRVAGVGLTGPRVVMAAFTAATMLVSASIARRVSGQWAGVLTMVLMGLAPSTSDMGRSVMSEVPASLCGALAVYVLIHYLGSDHLCFLVLAGLLAGLGAWFKYPAAMLVLILLVAQQVADRRRARPPEARAWRGALLIAAALSPIAIDTLIYGVDPQWLQVVGTLALSSQEYEMNILRSLDDFREFFAINNWGLALLALTGIIMVVRRREPRACLLSCWLLLYFASMIVSSPLGSQHIHLMLPPLSILSGIALQRLPVLLKTACRRTATIAQRLELAVATLAVCLLLVCFPASISKTLSLYRSDRVEKAALYSAVEAVATHTHPQDQVLSDLAMITFRAGRSAPPWLTNTSGMRFNTELLTETMVQNQAERRAPAAVVFWEDKLVEDAPEFVDEIRRSYVEVYREDQTLEDGTRRLRAVYIRPDRIN